jgi:hypothetical protein
VWLSRVTAMLRRPWRGAATTPSHGDATTPPVEEVALRPSGNRRGQGLDLRYFVQTMTSWVPSTPFWTGFIGRSHGWVTWANAMLPGVGSPVVLWTVT